MFFWSDGDKDKNLYTGLMHKISKDTILEKSRAKKNIATIHAYHCDVLGNFHINIQGFRD